MPPRFAPWGREGRLDRKWSLDPLDWRVDRQLWGKVRLQLHDRTNPYATAAQIS